MPNDIIKKLNAVSKSIDRMPSRAAVIAVNFSKERFVRKNWVDSSRKPWKKRQNERARGSLMNRTGRLKRSIRKISVGKEHIIIGTDVPFAELHNEGGTVEKTVTVREHSRKITRGRKGGNTTVSSHSRKMNLSMPQRQFIGESGVLLRRVERMIEREFKNALK
ncbi:phage virion morphogenesis protein [Aquimarina latercula]|uniref:phage virion morphogenesis protein n=1 Tax=Aquimarina latercula TaxID=987 RepID=UPI0004828A69|nr:phage virion morphogenesis protein [Aquimarina latercula]